MEDGKRDRRECFKPDRPRPGFKKDRKTGRYFPKDEDLLYGGAEYEVLSGGTGADIFAMSKGIDRAMDFSLSQ